MKVAATVGILALWVPAAGLLAAEVAVKSGDVVVFLGDEVTEEYSAANRPDRIAYPTFVESFLTVRYPDVRVSYFNASMANATAASTLERLERDVMPLKPTVAIICLGLQEAGMKAFDQGLLDAHTAGMKNLVGALKKANCRVYVMSPPSVDEQTPGSAALQQVDYNGTLAKYTVAQKEIAAAAGVTFIDWYSESVAAREKALKTSMNFAFSPDGLRHSPRSHGLAAMLVLEALKAEPIAVEITLDWKTGAIRSNPGEASLTVAADGSREIKVAGLPLPWPTFSGQFQLFATDWEAAKMCRYMLKIDNLPEQSAGLMISDGARQVPMLRQQVVEGLNLVVIEPLRSLPAAQELSNLIRRKNYTRVHAWRDQELQPIKEPELVDAQKALVAAWYKYFAGYEKIIARTPKVFDLSVQLKDLTLTLQPPASPATRPATAPAAQ